MKKFCCEMREFFLFGILDRRSAEGKEPASLVNFVSGMNEHGPVIRIKFCPFCGKDINPDDSVDITKTEIQDG